jgi:thiol-disulfide isomerase/thioredoxin
MTKPSLAILCMIFAFSCKAQIEPAELLKRVNDETTQAVAGEYVFHSKYTRTSNNATSADRDRIFSVKFKKDEQAPAGFKLLSIGNGFERLYDGQYLYTNRLKDSVLTLDKSTEGSNKIASLSSDYTFYPYFHVKNMELQHWASSSLIDKVTIVDRIKWHGEDCYKVQLGQARGTNGGSAESYMYVSTKTNLVMGQFTKLARIIGEVTEAEIFEEYTEAVKMRDLPDAVFNISSFTFYKKFLEKDDTKSPNNVLSVGTPAPTWDLPLLNNQHLSSGSLANKIVVLDFWFKECPPCVEQLIDLSRLKLVYGQKGVEFIGINIKDDPQKDNLEKFLLDRKLPLTTVYNGQQVQRQYGVAGAPVLYIVDKSGRIAAHFDGYTKDFKQKLISVLDAELAK